MNIGLLIINLPVLKQLADEMFTLCAAGLKGSVTSKRSHLVIIDDCIKSASDISNPDIRKSMDDNWNAVIAPTMFEGGRAICLGTRFRHDDIHATTFNEQNNWRQIVLSAIQTDPKTGDEVSYWPEMWSLDYLKEKKTTSSCCFFIPIYESNCSSRRIISCSRTYCKS